jgi:hypothetical protein
MTMPFVIIPVGRANPRAKQFAGLAESSSRQAARLPSESEERMEPGLLGLRAVLPHALLFYTGLYLFVLPYATERTGG